MNKWLLLLVGCLMIFALLPGCSPEPGRPAALTPAIGSTGDPPLIPHEVDAADGGASCQECHRTGEDGAPKYPDWHATLTDCRQCHVSQTEVQPFAPSY